MSVTFDTNVLLSATLWDGSVAQKLLFELIKKEIKIYSTPSIISEYQRVLKRDFDFSEKEIAEILEKVLSFVIMVNPNLKVELVKDDPDDKKIIGCALESKSEYLLTYDQHLLKLKEIQGIRIITPEEARTII